MPHSNKQEKQKYFREYRIKNKERLDNYSKNYRENNLKAWSEFLIKETNCEICGVGIYFNSHKSSKIHFDHRDENATIKNGPFDFLRLSPPTKDRIQQFKESNFGYLCNKCNSFLPTKEMILLER